MTRLDYAGIAAYEFTRRESLLLLVAVVLAFVLAVEVLVGKTLLGW